MTTKTKNTKRAKRAAPAKAAANEGGALRANMRALAKRSLPDLRAAYQQATGKEPGDLKRDALIKTLVASGAARRENESPQSNGKATVGSLAVSLTKPRERDPRIPATGTIIQKSYKDRALEVEVLDEGFRFEGKEYRSLTAVAMEVTGAKSINGLLFFGLTKRTPPAADAAAATATTEAPAAAEPKSTKKPKGARRAKRSGR